MAQTYCGKDCAACAYMEDQTCAGCRQGPGAQISGDCEIAKCCRAKGHADCTSCLLSDHCGSFLSRRNAPAQRKKKQEAEAFLASEQKQKAAFLAPRLILLSIAMFLQSTGYMLALVLFEELAIIRYPALIVTIASGAVCGGILLLLAAEEEKYRTAGICMLIATAINAVTITVFRNDPIVSPLLFLLSSAIILLATYFEITGHVAVLTQIDQALAREWEKFWLGFFCASAIILVRLLLIRDLNSLGSMVIYITGILWFAHTFVHPMRIIQTARRFLRYKKEG